MLLNLSKKTWTEGLLLDNFAHHAASNEKVMRRGLLVQQLSGPASVHFRIHIVTSTIDVFVACRSSCTYCTQHSDSHRTKNKNCSSAAPPRVPAHPAHDTLWPAPATHTLM